jgi:chromosome segregation ATPase
MMKNTLALTVAIAAVGVANAGNLRAQAPKQLLERCSGKDAKVEGCCDTDKTATHDLYKKMKGKFEGMPFTCCSKSMGMWMPTGSKTHKDKFCGLGHEAALAKTAMANVNSLTDKMVNVLDRLNDQKHSLKADFRSAYMAHENTEDSERAKEATKVKEIKFLAGEQTKTQSALDGASNALAANMAKQKELQAIFEKDMEALKEKTKKAEDLSKKLRVANEKELKELKKMQAEITKCDSKNKDLAAHKESMKKKLAAAEAAADKAKTDGEAAKKEHEKCQKESAEAKKKMEEARAKLEEGAKKYNKVIAGAKKNIELVQAQIADLNDLTAFIETQINPADCDDNCQKFKVWDSTKYINGDESMMDDAKKYITTEIEGLHGVLKEIKAVKKRIYQLQDLDADLHKKIMADVFKAHKKLETTIKVAKAELQKTLDELAKVEAESKKVEAAIPVMEAAFLKDMNSQKGMLAKAQKDEENLRLVMEEIKTAVTVHKDLFKECAAVGKQLEQCSKAAEAAAKEAEAAANQLEEANAKDKQEFDRLKAENDANNRKLMSENSILESETSDLKASARMYLGKSAAASTELQQKLME